MVTAASDRRMRRRGGRRQKGGSTPAALGKALRQGAGGGVFSLTEINDRTGVPWQQLEALEEGNLSRFPDLRTRRAPPSAATPTSWASKSRVSNRSSRSTGGPPSPDSTPTPASTNGGHGGQAQNTYITAAVPMGHLSRYPGDGTHLRAFTQTDEVPGVKRVPVPAGSGHEANPELSDTGSFPAAPGIYRGVRHAPLLLRFAMWFVAVLLAVALGGLAVQHYQPQWLEGASALCAPPARVDRRHLRHLRHRGGVRRIGRIGRIGRGGEVKKPAHPSPVSWTAARHGQRQRVGAGVHCSVVVAAWAPCWTVVHSRRASRGSLRPRSRAVRVRRSTRPTANCR